MTTYIHYGSKHFDPNKFQPIKNIECFVKPEGGLWASNVASNYGWRNWCLNANFDTNLEDSFCFTISETANILTITNVNQLKNLPQMGNKLSILPFVFLNFEKILANGVDAIEVLISQDSTNEGNIFINNLYICLNTWDCDSILIMNPNIIKEIEEV